MEQGFHHLVRREETIRCSIALEPRSTAATHSCAVLFCAAYLGSTHGEDGKEVKLPCWDENSATYAYGAWDKHCKSKHYKFVHEPLMTGTKASRIAASLLLRALVSSRWEAPSLPI